MLKDKNTNKKRGVWLTSALVISFIGHILAIILSLTPNFALPTKFHMAYPYWYIVQYFLVNLISLFLIIGVWQWKKIIVYIEICKFIIESLIVIFIHVNYFYKPELSFNLVLMLAEAFFFYYPLFLKRKYFE